MNNKIFIGLVVLAVGGLVGWYFLKGTPAAPAPQQVVATPTPSGSNLGAPESATSGGTSGVDKGGVVARTVVTYTDTGFAPKTITVKAGTPVSFVNDSNNLMWVASDPHPTHTLLPGFDELRGVDRDSIFEYVFTNVGTWTYHNHLNPSAKGTVVVTQ